MPDVASCPVKPNATGWLNQSPLSGGRPRPGPVTVGAVRSMWMVDRASGDVAGLDVVLDLAGHVRALRVSGECLVVAVPAARRRASELSQSHSSATGDRNHPCSLGARIAVVAKQMAARPARRRQTARAPTAAPAAAASPQLTSRNAGRYREERAACAQQCEQGAGGEESRRPDPLSSVESSARALSRGSRAGRAAATLSPGRRAARARVRGLDARACSRATRVAFGGAPRSVRPTDRRLRRVGRCRGLESSRRLCRRRRS